MIVNKKNKQKFNFHEIIGLKTDIVPATRPETETQAEAEEVIVCAACSSPVTDPSRQIQVSGRFSHVFANPHGHVFEIGCFSEAKGCMAVSTPSDEFSWFPGFSWQIGICRQCVSHLGWVFISEREKFYGLILDKLVFP